jgi:hypothetical protein
MGAGGGPADAPGQHPRWCAVLRWLGPSQMEGWGEGNRVTCVRLHSVYSWKNFMCRCTGRNSEKAIATATFFRPHLQTLLLTRPSPPAPAPSAPRLVTTC